MKKITLILLALISGTAFAQTGDSAEIHAEIVEPITIEATGNLNFGSIDGNQSGKVTVSPAGSRDADNKKLLISTAAEGISAASFSIKAAQNFTYSITIVGDDLVNGTATLPIEFLHDINGTSKTTATGTGSAQTLRVGGILTVGENQVAGNYEGEVSVTVDYN